MSGLGGQRVYDVAIESADVILVRSDPRAVTAMIRCQSPLFGGSAGGEGPPHRRPSGR